jgi:hypothetical protein
VNQKLPPNPERSFGLSVGTVLVLIAAILWWRERMLGAQAVGAIGAVLVILGQFAPALLKVPSRWWWRFALVLGWINARVILSVLFLLVLSPIGLLWRVIGRDPLRMRKTAGPAWLPYPKRYRSRDHFQRMY